MQIDWKLLVDLLTGLAWPAVAVFALYLLRTPLIELVAQIAHRAKKLSVYNVSVELATLPALTSSWSAGPADVRQLPSSQIFDSASQTLFQELLVPRKADYAVVDLGTGERWLTSRLYIFALILGKVAGLRAFVFLETRGGIRRRLLGTATPANIIRGLAAKYPWLEEAHVRAAASQYNNAQNQPSLFYGSETWRVNNFVKNFVENIQRMTTPPQDEANTHLALGTSPTTWERTRWINGELLEKDLTGILDMNAWCHDVPDKPRSAVAEAVLARSSDFVALVDEDRCFAGLVDRNALLDRMWKNKAAEKNSDSYSNIR